MQARTNRMLVGSALAGMLVAGPAAAGWPVRANAIAGKQGNVAGTPLVFDIEGDGFLETAVLALDDGIYVWNHDGSLRPGWPVTAGFGDGTVGSLALADLVGDGSKALVAFGDNGTDMRGKVVVARITAGTPDSVTVNSLDLPAPPTNIRQTGKSTPAIIDCMKFRNGSSHPGQEIVVRDGRGFVNVYAWVTGTSTLERVTTGDGLDTLPTTGDDPSGDRYNLHSFNPSVNVFDVGGGQTLLAAASTNGNVYSWTLNSTVSTNLSATVHLTLTGGGGFFGSPVIADLDPDTDGALDLDIVAGSSDGQVYVWEIWGGTGGARTGWPVAAGSSGAGIHSSPAVANVDGTGNLEIAVGSNDDHVYVFKSDGDGFISPLATGGDVTSSPLLVDLDGVAGLEIVATSLDGRLYAWSPAGSLLEGWPKRMNGAGAASPAVADMRSGPRRSVIAASREGTVYCFDLASKYDAASNGWSQFRGGVRRAGHDAE